MDDCIRIGLCGEISESTESEFSNCVIKFFDEKGKLIYQNKYGPPYHGSTEEWYTMVYYLDWGIGLHKGVGIIHHSRGGGLRNQGTVYLGPRSADLDGIIGEIAKLVPKVIGLGVWKGD